MQYRPPNANLEIGSQTVSIVRVDTSCWSYLADVGVSLLNMGMINKLILLVTQLRSADKCIVNIMKVYIERNNLQLELIRYGIKS